MMSKFPNVQLFISAPLRDITYIVDDITVPTPTVSVTGPNTQTVGQSLTLQCEVTTVRGITSRVDIVWSSGSTLLRRINDTTLNTTMINSLVYMDSFTILSLSTTDEGRMIQCEVVINVSPSVMASDIITLDVTGEYILILIFWSSIHYYTDSSHSYSHHITIWSHTRSYGG